MGEEGVSLRAGWESFYVIAGAAAAALTGLQFVVITLAAQRSRGSSETNRAFGTPTIVHFCAVLLLAGILAAPWPSLAGAAFAIGACGAAGLAYAAAIIRAVRRQTQYVPVLEDWIWHFTLPPLGYALLVIAALIMGSSPSVALFLVGAVVMLLLFAGIHNAWDAVTFIALNLRQQRKEPEQHSRSDG